MSPRHFFALISVPLWIGVAVTGCNHHVADPPIIIGGIQSEAELINRLKTAYQKRDYDTFATLFHPDYQFFLNEAQPDGTTLWGLTDELRIHQRMFHPQGTIPPVPPELWIVSIDVTLVARDAFRDVPSAYLGPENPTGFARENFAVTQADYAASIFFQTQGQTQYRVDGVASFVVVNDLSKVLGDDGKFLIYRWEDLGTFASSSKSQTTWTGVKSLYRVGGI